VSRKHRPRWKQSRPPQPGSATQITEVRQHTADHNEPTVPVATFPPCVGRRRWAFAVSCARCGGDHLYFATVLTPSGIQRRSPCGQRVTIHTGPIGAIAGAA
jgi:hypothetical protein